MASESPIPRISEAGALAFSTGVVAVAMLWVGRLEGGDWVTAVTWVTGALMFGRAAAVAADGYAVTSQVRLQRTLRAEEKS